jgi:hypothetical protein
VTTRAVGERLAIHWNVHAASFTGLACRRMPGRSLGQN